MKQAKKNTLTVDPKLIKKLNSNTLRITVIGLVDREMTAAEALRLGNQQIVNDRGYYALSIADQLLKVLPTVELIQLLRFNALLLLEDIVNANEFVKDYKVKLKKNKDFQVSLSRFYLLLGDSDKSITYLKGLLNGEGKEPSLLHRLGYAYNLAGDSDKAKKCLRLALGKNNVSNNRLLALSILSELAAIDKLSEQEKKVLLTVKDSQALNVNDLSKFYFAMAEIEKREKNINSEIQHLHSANSNQAKAIGHNTCLEDFKTLQQKKYELTLEKFSDRSPSYLQHIKKDTEDTPIIILGFPRSGTTLLEQLLGAHSMIGQVGESRAVSQAIAEAYINYPNGYHLEDFPIKIDEFPGHCYQSMLSYTKQFQYLLTDKLVYVDKFLGTYWYVGLTANLFENAKYIHINRNPMDIFLSCYRGGIVGVPSTTDIAQMAVQYVYMKKLIGHWLNLYPDQVHVVDYADLVDEPEKNIRPILELIGLEWEDNILEFHKRKNVVRTLSVNQVRKGIYKTSIDKWKPFEKMLLPAIETLAEYGVSKEGVRYL